MHVAKCKGILSFCEALSQITKIKAKYFVSCNRVWLIFLKCCHENPSFHNLMLGKWGWKHVAQKIFLPNWKIYTVPAWVLILLSKLQPSNFFCPPGTENLYKSPQADKAMIIQILRTCLTITHILISKQPTKTC